MANESLKKRIDNEVVMVLPPNTGLVEVGCGGIFKGEPIPLKLPDYVQRIPCDDARYLNGYRFTVDFKRLPADILENILDSSIIDHQKNSRLLSKE
jgi:hypothetical protein